MLTKYINASSVLQIGKNIHYSYNMVKIGVEKRKIRKIKQRKRIRTDLEKDKTFGFSVHRGDVEKSQLINPCEAVSPFAE